jgi:hypothetical protein
MIRPGVALLALSLVGCGSVGQQMTAHPADYQHYRDTRTAKTSEARLAASFTYLEKEPEGRWRDEVKAWFDRAEPAYYQRAENSLERLHSYLATLPRGPHAKDAQDRIAEFKLAGGFAKAREDRLLDEARENEEKLKDADEMRRTVVREFSLWAGQLSQIHTWGRPTSELDSELIYHFRLEPPEGRCAEELCKKSVSLPFAIPDQGKLVPRQVVFDATFELFRGGVVRARLAGPELFSRISEAAELRAVKPEDAQARAESIARAVGIVDAALGAKFSTPECNKPAVSPVVLLRECNGVRIRMSAAPTGETDDELLVEPVTP